MSFDFNSHINLSNVQATSKTFDGGAGNTGYFQQQKSNEDNIDLKFKEDNGDSVDFSHEDKMEEENNDTFIDALIKFVNIFFDFIKKIFKVE